MSETVNEILTSLFNYITILEVTQRFDPVNWPSQDKEYPKGSCRRSERYKIFCAHTNGGKESCETVTAIIAKLTELGLVWSINSHEDTGYIEISAVTEEREVI